MQFDKSQIIEQLKSRGDHDQAAQAESELPDKVDPQNDAGMLERLGINSQDLIRQLPGGLGGLDGLGG